MTKGSTTWTYTYDADGLRTKRTNGIYGYTYTYVYNGSSLAMMTTGNNTLSFSYDASGTALAVQYNGTIYYYKTNLQGDVMGIVDSNGTTVVTYAYNAWGVLLACSGTMADTLGTLNPLRYRGYVYDTETGLYYLQSRYYNPEWGRFINGDGYNATGQGFIGNNMFAYCINNPVNFVDATGQVAEALQAWMASMWWLCIADTTLPVGDIIFGLGIVVLGVEAICSPIDATPQVVYDEETTTVVPPITDNGDNNGSKKENDDDDDLDDDYYDDDNNFGGRQKIGKPKGSTPGNNQAQNKQFRDATKGLKPSEQEILHRQNTKQGFGYKEIQQQAKSLLQLKRP